MSRYSLETQNELFARIRAGDMDARDEVISSHFKLVRSLINKSWLNIGIEYDDLFQAGCEGLLMAVASFDPSRSVQFATYATPYIRGEIMNAVRTESNNGLLAIPERTYYLYVKITRRVNDLTEAGETDVASKVACVLNIPVQQVYDACAFMAALSNADFNFEDYASTPTSSSAEETFFNETAIADILDDIPCLTDFEKSVLRYRFRFAPYDDGTKEMTYAEIGARLNISTSCAYNTVERAMSKLRSSIARKPA